MELDHPFAPARSSIPYRVFETVSMSSIVNPIYFLLFQSSAMAIGLLLIFLLSVYR